MHLPPFGRPFPVSDPGIGGSECSDLASGYSDAR
jgi:hypothetical protein